MADDRKDLPSASATNWAQRVNETLRTYMGKAGPVLDRGVTVRDLVNAGIADLKAGSNFSGLKPGSNIGQGAVGPQGPPGPAVPYEPDLTPPPTPTGFTAVAAISNILLEHAVPGYSQGHGHGRTRVYGATWISGALPTFSAAVEITQFTGTVFAHATNPATTWHLWIKWESADGVLSTSPAGGANGVAVTTGQDVSKLVAAMTGPGNPFKIISSPITLPDGTVVPVGTYTSDAYMASFVAARGQIALLAVDDARIASVSVAKMTAGSIAVGQYIQSTGYVAGSAGWRINGNGNLEASNAIVRGAIYASSGTFTGTVSASTINGSTFNGGTFNGGTFNSNTLNSVTINSATLNSMAVNSGLLNIQGDGGTGWGYARSFGKWFDDGVNGWVFARAGSDGTTFAEIRAGAGRLWFASWGDYGLEMPGIRMTNGGLTITQLNVIGTSNIADMSVSDVITAQSETATSALGQNNEAEVLYLEPNVSANGRIIVSAESQIRITASVSITGELRLYVSGILRRRFALEHVFGGGGGSTTTNGRGSFFYSAPASGPTPISLRVVNTSATGGVAAQNSANFPGFMQAIQLKK